MVVETGWIELPASLSEDQVKEDRGVLVKKVVSKYDAPKAVKAIHDDGLRTLTVEFRYYGGPEPLRHVKFADRIFAVTGKQSHRIYMLRFEAVSAEGGLQDMIERSFADLRAATERKRREVSAGNSVATENVLSRIVKPWLPQAQLERLAAG